MTRIVRTDGSVEQRNGAPHPEAASVSKTEPVKQQLNPAESPEERRERIKNELRTTAMNLPSLKMHVPEIPGYHSHWMNDEKGKIQRALRMGYEFAENEDVIVHDFSMAGDSTKTGNQDLGSRVSMVVGVDESNQPLRAYLMKIPIERWDLAQELLQERNDQISAALRRGRIGVEGVQERDMPIPKVVEISRRDHKIAPAATFKSTVEGI